MKRFLKNSVVLASILLSGCYELKKATDFNPTAPNKYLYSFPEKIPRIESVKKLPVHNAKACLVHFRNLHYRSDTPEDRLVYALDVQKDLYQAISFLADRQLVSHVYQEGLTEKLKSIEDDLTETEIEIVRELNPGLKERTERKITELQEAIREENLSKKPGDLEDKMRYHQDVLTTIETLKASLPDMESSDDIFRRYLERSFLVRGAEVRLRVEGKLELRIGEDEELNRKSNQIVLRYHLIDPKISQKVIYEDREDKLLEIIHQDEEDIAITVFGGGHDFRDNIRNWNRKNPNHKYSLIVITPESYNNLKD